jgi:pilus assembly protein Flp/PilA
MLDYLLIQIRGLQARTERGASAVEYGLLVGLIAVAIIFVVLALGGKLQALFGHVATTLP